MHHLLDCFHDFGVGQGNHFAHVALVGEQSEHATHDLGAGLGHAGHDPDLARLDDRPDLDGQGLAHALFRLHARMESRLDGHIQVGLLALH